MFRIDWGVPRRHRSGGHRCRRGGLWEENRGGLPRTALLLDEAGLGQATADFGVDLAFPTILDTWAPTWHEV